MGEMYSLLGVDAKDITTLEKYLQDYFTNILKKLKDIKAQSKQTDIYFWSMLLSSECSVLNIAWVHKIRCTWMGLWIEGDVLSVGWRSADWVNSNRIKLYVDNMCVWTVKNLYQRGWSYINVLTLLWYWHFWKVVYSYSLFGNGWNGYSHPIPWFTK